MAKKVIRQILLIYLTTTGIFLTIFFALWYQKLYEELVVLKGATLSITIFVFYLTDFYPINSKVI